MLPMATNRAPSSHLTIEFVKFHSVRFIMHANLLEPGRTKSLKQTTEPDSAIDIPTCVVYADGGKAGEKER
jgi:hypothetical protein